MQPTLTYQRWLEFDLPSNLVLPSGNLPMWSWPVELPDGRTILTFLYRPLPSPQQPRSAPRTILLEISPQGDAQPWPPGAGYPAPVIFHANDAGDLIGLDLTQPGKIYACRPDGRHLWTLDTRVRLDCLIAPLHFFQIGTQLCWMTDAGLWMTADLSSGQPQNVTPCKTDIPSFPSAPPEVRFPHTHLLRTGALFIFDFDPMPRITRYILK